MIGKVIEGRYVGASICKLPEKNVLFIETEDGERIALSKKNAISIDDVTDQYPSYGGKVMMVMWNDFETSIVQIGIQQSDRNALNKEGIISSPLPVPVKQEVRAGRKNSKKTLLVFLGTVVLISVCIFLADRLINNNHKDTPHLEHTWILATCETPKTCKECGITQGTAIDHTYKSEVVVEPNY
ncbi:MAG: hypothetical protein Q4B61_13905, partial [Bacteroidales bacterium]|nr:hypothetical protein [Bacteroidales bacterium]